MLPKKTRELFRWIWQTRTSELDRQMKKYEKNKTEAKKNDRRKQINTG